MSGSRSHVNVAIFMVSIGLANALSTGLQPLLPYFIRGLGATVEQVGFALALSRVSYLILSPIGGVLADMWGRKTVLVLSPLITGFAYLLLAESTDWLSSVVPLMLIMLPVALTGPAVFAYIADLSSAERYGRFYGLYFGVVNAATVIGYLAAGPLVEFSGYRAVFQITALTLLLSAALRIALKETRTRKDSTTMDLSLLLRSSVKAASKGPLPALITLRSLNLAQIWVLTGIVIPLVARDVIQLSESDLTLMFAFESIVFASLSTLGGRLVEGERWFLYIWLEIVMRSLSVLVLITMSTWFGVLLALLLGSGLAIFFQPFVDSRTSAHVDRSIRGGVWGIQQLLYTASTMVATYGASLVWETLGYQIAIWFTVLPVMFMIPIVHQIRKQTVLANAR
ncbi:MAG: MFS transporter [Thaumarchaeota archaeon]|nr:MFS transporter [Candidatus Calditenuaceae archaeon]MDW8187491.1 MFS transporter [Nitrososphaerota archaeon]